MGVGCRWCGKFWARHFELEVTCPECGAYPGNPCTSVQGGRVIGFHSKRTQEAVDRGIYHDCPKRPGRAPQRSLPYE